MLQPNTNRSLSAAMADPGAYRQVKDILEFVDGPGDRYFVHATNGSSAYDGKSPDKPKATLAQAVAAATTAQGDRIYLLPGHSETVTAPVALSKSNISVIGLGEPGNTLITTATADINLIDITGDKVLIENVMFTNTATVTVQTEMLDVGGSFVTIRNCIFNFAAAANVEGINVATGETDCKVIGCQFILPNAGESCILWAATRMEIAYCHFDLSGGDGLAIEQLATPGNGCRIHHNTFAADGTDTVMMSWQAAPGAGGAVYSNRVFDANGLNNTFGADTDLDTWFQGNFHGSTAGAEVAIDPSV